MNCHKMFHVRFQFEFIDVEPDQYVALEQHGDHQSLPIIGKVIEVAPKHVQLQMMQGGYSKQWKPELDDETNDVITRKIHRKYVLCNNVRFTNARRLPIETKRNLQKLYLN